VKKVTLDNFFKTITGLTEDTSPAVASDYVVTYDASASAAKKVLLNKIGSFGSQLLHVREEQVSGTNGGTFTNGAWRTRVINTAKTNEIGASLGSNQITLLAGTYFVIASAPAAFTNSHKAKLYNITDAADVILGTSEYNGTTAQTRSWIIGRFTISGTKVFEIQHQCQSTRATDGLGTAVSFGTEIFTEAMFWKVA
jgi:hypothetical protein